MNNVDFHLTSGLHFKYFRDVINMEIGQIAVETELAILKMHHVPRKLGSQVPGLAGIF